jgi:hypothetical protein
MQAGFYLLVHVWRIPVLVHGSLPISGVVAAIGGAMLGGWIGLAITLSAWCAFTATLAVHEAGHAVAVRWMGIGVRVIVFNPQGGCCLASGLPATVGGCLLFLAAGWMAQLVLLAVTAGVLIVRDTLDIVTVCLILAAVINLLMLATSLAPYGGHDGARALKLVRLARRLSAAAPHRSLP